MRYPGGAAGMAHFRNTIKPSPPGQTFHGGTKSKQSLSPIVMRLYSLICEQQSLNFFLFNFYIHTDVQGENPVINGTQLPQRHAHNITL